LLSGTAIKNYETDTQTEIQFYPFDLYSEFTEYTENELIKQVWWLRCPRVQKDCHKNYVNW